MTMTLAEFDAIVAEHDLQDRAHTAALPIAKAVLRESEHYSELNRGNGGANEWVRQQAEPLADAMATAMLDALRSAVGDGPRS